VPELEGAIDVSIHEHTFHCDLGRLVFLDQVMHTLEDGAQPPAQRFVLGRDAAVCQLDALPAAAVDDAEAGTPRAWIEA
jgi:hypothetical protein